MTAAVIFDCDGTLVDSEGIANAELVAYVAELGLELSVERAIELFRGRKMDECVADLERFLGARLPEQFVPEYRRRMEIGFRERLRAVDGAHDLVRSLTIPFCVASSAPRAKIELTLSLAGLLPHFEGRIFSSYEVGSWKPDPGLFLHAADAMGVVSSQCVVVEDSLPGIHAGVAAGMQVFALLPEDRSEPLPAGVRIVRSLTELRPFFARDESVI